MINMWALIINKWILVTEWENDTNLASQQCLENQFKNKG